jgi:hypothetical protein
LPDVLLRTSWRSVRCHLTAPKEGGLRLTRQPVAHDTVIQETVAAVDTIGRMTPLAAAGRPTRIERLKPELQAGGITPHLVETGMLLPLRFCAALVTRRTGEELTRRSLHRNANER